MGRILAAWGALRLAALAGIVCTAANAATVIDASGRMLHEVAVAAADGKAAPASGGPAS